jgi:hypothetical protein
VGIFNCSNAVTRDGVGEGSVTRKIRRARKLREGHYFNNYRDVGTAGAHVKW